MQIRDKRTIKKLALAPVFDEHEWGRLCLDPANHSPFLKTAKAPDPIGFGERQSR